MACIERRGLIPARSAACTSEVASALIETSAERPWLEDAVVAAAHCCSTTWGASHPERTRSAAECSRRSLASCGCLIDMECDLIVRSKQHENHCMYWNGESRRVASHDAASSTIPIEPPLRVST
eukprot:scaffold171947_cov28-Tisochrysis_lutea.AAC.2